MSVGYIVPAAVICTRQVDGTQGVVRLGCFSESMWQQVFGVWKRGY